MPLAIVVVPTVIVPADAEIVHVPPKAQFWPLTVVALLVREALPILVRVFVDPEIDLFVNVSVVARATSVSVAAGIVRTLDPKAPVVGCKVIAPDVALLNASDPTDDPAVPVVSPPLTARLVPVAAAMLGVPVSVGLAAKTALPEPVVARLPKVPALL